ncbi:helix-turn-helix domain-containing protein [Rhizobium herbae]|jgi:transcriptional regulator with XRE-family HTH domain|uniref:Transcriptional regulator with XRE-family HTH domain n=1 Tax=Rhizobium herbae TaxID=508661 RepID=A0ABS4EUJ2_9HYPH|nr:helix-turn-helix transcriptional regulator [Rhizobium herbae]MBP1861626.1 transcriptional regulator with XRE-family HTH domain [Rhizobium herbae]
MDTRKRIAWNLRRLRTSANVTQEILAVDAHVDRTVISDLERGRHNASVDLLDRLAQALQFDISELFVVPAGTDDEPAPIKPGRKPKAR